MAWEPSTYKKDVSGEMPNAYDPKKVEQCWDEFWETDGLIGKVVGHFAAGLAAVVAAAAAAQRG